MDCMRRVLGSLALALALSCGGPFRAVAQAPASAGPGCDPSRPAVAHHAGGVALNPQPSITPIPCGVTTGYPSSEDRIAVTSTGTVFYSPAIVPIHGVGCPHFVGSPLNCAGLARTFDQGFTWTAVLPPDLAGRPNYAAAANEVQIYLDRGTNRLFRSSPDLNGTSVTWTSDDGRTWGSSVACCPVAENPRFLAAHPVRSTTVGYPNIVYLCSNTSLAGGEISVAGGRICQKSLNGGRTWIIVGQGLTNKRPMSVHRECGNSGDETAGYPAATSEGFLYLVISCGGKNYLSRSVDEGRSWPIIANLFAANLSGGPTLVPGSGGAVPGSGGALPGSELRSDSEDNLYLAWGVARGVELAISRDRGKTWTSPMNVAAPGVDYVLTSFFTVGSPRQVAFSYYGQRAGQSGFDGYLTVTNDALDTTPVFWSATVNNPSRPLLYEPNPSNPLIFVDYIGVDIGPDGTPWASFLEDCAPHVDDRACLTGLPRMTTDHTLGFAGRLLMPSG